jgi:hypothetical protein
MLRRIGTGCRNRSTISWRAISVSNASYWRRVCRAERKEELVAIYDCGEGSHSACCFNKKSTGQQSGRSKMFFTRIFSRAASADAVSCDCISGTGVSHPVPYETSRQTGAAWPRPQVATASLCTLFAELSVIDPALIDLRSRQPCRHELTPVIAPKFKTVEGRLKKRNRNIGWRCHVGTQRQATARASATHPGNSSLRVQNDGDSHAAPGTRVPRQAAAMPTGSGRLRVARGMTAMPSPQRPPAGQLPACVW